MNNNDALPMLEVKGLSAYYGKAQVLFGVDLNVRRGEVVALLGRNGAGKSTTLKAVMQLVTQSAAVVQFRGHDLRRLEPHQVARLGLGFVPEDRRIFTDLTVRENLLVGRQAPRLWDDGSPALSWTVEELFDLFPVLAAIGHRRAGLLSGGEQQMLTVARTLMGNPYLILLDEPSEGVAPVVVEQMFAMLLTLKERGASVLMSEQNLHFAELISDRAYLLEKGQVCFRGTLDQLREQDEVWRRALLV